MNIKKIIRKELIKENESSKEKNFGFSSGRVIVEKNEDHNNYIITVQSFYANKKGQQSFEVHSNMLYDLATVFIDLSNIEYPEHVYKVKHV